MLATAFGLDIESAIPLSFLAGSAVRPTGRLLRVSGHEGNAASLQWPASAEIVCDERQPDGSAIFQIEAHPEAGFLISGPDYGAYLLAADGRSLRYMPEGHDEGAWQRLLIAQVLPFAALLQGLEVFHASAVVWEGTGIAFLGPSRAGKTSLALELCQRGARFLADDVLALEIDAGRLLAHPGTPVAGVDRSEPAVSEADDTWKRFRPDQILAVNAREQLVQMHGAVEPAPVAALFFIDRRADGQPSPRFTPVAEAQMLLAATFNFVLATPQRLQVLLEVCAAAATLRVDRVVIGPATSTSDLATAIEQRLSSSG